MRLLSSLPRSSLVAVSVPCRHVDSFLDGIAYQEAVQYALDNTDPKETLIISTADHGHAIAFNGYCGRGSLVTGLYMEIDYAGEMHGPEPNLAADDNTYTVISVGNGPGSILYVSFLFPCVLELRTYLESRSGAGRVRRVTKKLNRPASLHLEHSKG